MFSVVVDCTEAGPWRLEVLDVRRLQVVFNIFWDYFLDFWSLKSSPLQLLPLVGSSLHLGGSIVGLSRGSGGGQFSRVSSH
jgi:hypothetical protein